jgi:hypothetical protein
MVQEESVRLKELGNEHFRSLRYVEAVEAYSAALAAAPSLTETERKAGGASVEDRAALLTNRGTAKLKLGDAEACVDDCNAALALDGHRVKSLFRRAQVRSLSSPTP